MMARRFLVLVTVLLARLVREGLFLRALLWPALLTACTLVGTALIMGVLKGAPTVAVSEDRFIAPLEEAGFAPELVSDPEAAFARAKVDKAIASGPVGVTIHAHFAGSELRNLETVVRDVGAASWRRTMHPIPPPADLREPTRQIAALVAILFTLYGVVMGAAVLYRDKQEGVLEAELSLPVPFWMHGLARLCASCLGLLAAFATTLLVLDGLMGIHQVGPWLVQGSAGAIAGAALGLGAMSLARGDNFSTPLSRALLLSMTLLAVGGASETAGHLLPVASIAALFAGHLPGPGPLPFALALCGLSTLLFGTRGFTA